MTGILAHTLISLAVLPGTLNLHTTPASSLETGFDSAVEAKQNQVHTVVKGDTLVSLAQIYYGDTSYWTVLWNDNPVIENPNVIEAGFVLTVREKTPETPETLREDLTERLKESKQTNILVYQSESVSDKEEVRPSVSPIVASAVEPLNEAQIHFLGTCEAGMIPDRNTGNGYYGAFQFSYGTWKSMNTRYERADLAPLEVQIDAVQRLLQRSSIYTQFPACARKMQSVGLI